MMVVVEEEGVIVVEVAVEVEGGAAGDAHICHDVAEDARSSRLVSHVRFARLNEKRVQHDVPRGNVQHGRRSVCSTYALGGRLGHGEHERSNLCAPRLV